jgi:hypothetical protein
VIQYYDALNLKADQKVGRNELDFIEKRSRFACCHHITEVCLNHVGRALESDSLLEAEFWLRLADNACKETLFWAEKQKPYPMLKVKKADEKDMAELMGHLEGARAVLQERSKK